MRCVSSLKSDEWSTLDTSTNAQFHQCCLLWQYPWLPWLSLFPRDTRAPITSTSSVQIGMDSSVSNCLINDWCESFRSLFGLLRARQCPFFYVCTHQFTVLFRAAGIGGVAEIHALLTPTTRGLREVLRREGIKDSDLVHWIKSILCVPGLNDTSICFFFFALVCYHVCFLFFFLLSKTLNQEYSIIE